VTPSRNIPRSHEKIIVLKRDLRGQKDKEANKKEDEEEEYVGEDKRRKKRFREPGRVERRSSQRRRKGERKHESEAARRESVRAGDYGVRVPARADETRDYERN
jgi:hypothetical protein